MNLSLIVIEKIKNYFGLPTNQFVALANLARTLDKEDFAFLGDVPDSEQDNADLVTQIYTTKYNFSHWANGLPNGSELVWNPDIDSENTLDKKYSEVLKSGKLNRKNQTFVNKWLKADNELDSPLYVITDPTTDIPFLNTSCTPDFYDKIDEPWTKITLSAAELASLDAAVRGKYPDSIYSQIDPLMNGEKLDIESISFEIQLASVQRNWFSQSLLQNRNWKMDGTDILSNGVDCTQGILPAYTSSMIFIKNVEWELVEGSSNNVAVLTLLQAGALTFGSLPIQGIPQGVNLKNLKTIRTMEVKPEGYQIFNQNIQHRFDSGDLIFQPSVDTEQIVTPAIPLNVHSYSVNTATILANTTSVFQNPVVEPVKVVDVLQSNVFVQTAPVISSSVLIKNHWRGPKKPDSASRGGDDKILLQSALRNREYYRYYPFVFAEVRPTETTYSVSGYVRIKGNNAALPEALVTVLFGEGRRLTALTDQNGWFSIVGVSKGAISINIGKQNYKTFEDTAQLDGNFNRNILLEQVATLPPGTFFLFGVINSRLPQLPNPEPDGEYVKIDEAVELDT